MTWLSTRRKASVGNNALSGMPPAKEMTVLCVPLPPPKARSRSSSAEMMRALRDSSAAQSRRCGTVTGRLAAREARVSFTNVPCPTCARASPEATSSS
jgi:hypothetical protein